jgi:molybdopterin biosynthesis enzyme
MKAETQAAQDLLGSATRSRIVVAMPLLAAEKVRVVSAAGRVLAEDIVAIVSLPPMAVSAMDG